jgi:hypothetical protein
LHFKLQFSAAAFPRFLAGGMMDVQYLDRIVRDAIEYLYG